MKSGNPRNAQRQQKDLEILETRLQSLYQPIRPRPEYVGNLRRHLESQMISMNASDENQGWHVMLVAASLLSGTFVAVLAIRGIKSYVDGMHQVSSSTDPELISSVN